MEESIRNAFELNAVPVNTDPVLSLAYLGDAVCALIVRTVLLKKANGKNGALHQRTLPYVSAVVWGISSAAEAPVGCHVVWRAHAISPNGQECRMRSIVRNKVRTITVMTSMPAV